jgi:hypothetical protein
MTPGRSRMFGIGLTFDAIAMQSDRNRNQPKFVFEPQ